MGKVTHGMTGTKLYKCWKNMKTRCYNSSSDRYQRYGGRGIRVCDDWLSSEAFIRWALSSGYQDGLTIDRKDNDGNYSPDNCRWVTKEKNHDEMMSRSHRESTGIYSEVNQSERKGRYRTSQGRTTKVLWKDTEYSFGSRSEAIDFIVGETGRSRKSVKSQVTSCLNPNSKCKTVAGGLVYE